MKGSDYIIKFLQAQGVECIFEVAGGMITHIIDSAYRQKLRLVSMHHEQAAAFAADGMARITGIPGIALATSGPGATNLLTGIGSCYFDSVPALFITGQVNRSEQKGTRPVRQLGFQETDIASMSAAVTKGAFRVKSPDELPILLESAFKLAVSGRPGPVVFDIPFDVQRAEISTKQLEKYSYQNQGTFSPDSARDLVAALKSARRPLILAGGGLWSSRSAGMLGRLLDIIHVPVACSLMALDVLPYDHTLRVGFIGSYGNRWANVALGRCDFLLVLGSRLDIRQTGADTDFIRNGRTIFHVDCDPGEINNRVTGCFPLVGDLRLFFESLLSTLPRDASFPRYEDWLTEISELKNKWPDTEELKNISGINPNAFMHELSRCSKSAAAFVSDVGNHQMWAAQSLELCEGQRFITSGGMGAMGSGLPLAIGVCYACNQKPVVLVAGDGGFQVNIQELQTVYQNDLPIKMVIMNNISYGMVRQFQETYFEKRYQSTYWGYSAPDFERIAEAYGIASVSIESQDEVGASLEKMWRESSKPFLLQVMIDPFTKAYPKIAFGRPITEMEPLAKPLDMEGT